jgi:hypothetical protein
VYFRFLRQEGLTVSFELSPKRASVAFDMTTGTEVDFDDVEEATCILDIHSNLSMNMGDLGLDVDIRHGNFSKWVSLEFNQGVAVTGLTSCGAVFIANRDFSRVAAGHMSGDAQFVEDWCAKLLRSGSGVEPYFILWGTGTSGSRKTGGMVLLQYMRRFGPQPPPPLPPRVGIPSIPRVGAPPSRRFGIPPSRAPAVASCGAIFLVRSGRGTAYASHTIELPFRRRGQAVRETRTFETTETGTIVSSYSDIKGYDIDDLVNQALLIYRISQEIDYEKIPMPFSAEAQKTVLTLHGKKVTKAYLEVLSRVPRSFRDEFVTFKIFKHYPDWIR